MTFEGEIAAAGGSRRMQMRFTLQARTPDQPAWSKVAAPGFGVWITAPRGLGRYLYDKTVSGLLAPAGYRAVVDFRWRNAAGKVIKTGRDTSRTCHQPDPRPNLSAGALTVTPAASRAAPLRGDAGQLGPRRRRAVRGGHHPRRDAAGRGAGRRPGRRRPPRDRARGAGLRPGEQIAVVVDATHEVDESDEDDNVLSVTC